MAITSNSSLPNLLHPLTEEISTISLNAVSISKKFEPNCKSDHKDRCNFSTSATADGLLDDTAKLGATDVQAETKEPSTSMILSSFGNTFDPYSATSTPLYQTCTFLQPSATELGPFYYGRCNNPTRNVLDSLMIKLEKADAAFCFTSGLAALGTIIKLVQPGQEIVAVEDIYGGSDKLLQAARQRGIIVKHVNMCDLNEAKSAISPATKLVLLESPTNPRMYISDIRKISEIAHSNGALVLFDNTIMSPVLCKPLELGADIVMESATKFISGHSDVLAGIIAVKGESLEKAIFSLQMTEGNVLAPFESWLCLRGIKTLELRMEKQQANAQKIAEYLYTHPRVKQVFYAGLPSHPGHSLHYSQAKGAGAVLSILTGSFALSKHIANNLKCFQTRTCLETFREEIERRKRSLKKKERKHLYSWTCSEHNNQHTDINTHQNICVTGPVLGIHVDPGLRFKNTCIPAYGQDHGASTLSAFNTIQVETHASNKSKDSHQRDNQIMHNIKGSDSFNLVSFLCIPANFSFCTGNDNDHCGARGIVQAGLANRVKSNNKELNFNDNLNDPNELEMRTSTDPQFVSRTNKQIHDINPAEPRRKATASGGDQRACTLSTFNMIQVEPPTSNKSKDIQQSDNQIMQNTKGSVSFNLDSSLGLPANLSLCTGNDDDRTGPRGILQDEMTNRDRSNNKDLSFIENLNIPEEPEISKREVNPDNHYQLKLSKQFDYDPIARSRELQAYETSKSSILSTDEKKEMQWNELHNTRTERRRLFDPG